MRRFLILAVAVAGLAFGAVTQTAEAGRGCGYSYGGYGRSYGGYGRSYGFSSYGNYGNYGYGYRQSYLPSYNYYQPSYYDFDDYSDYSDYGYGCYGY